MAYYVRHTKWITQFRVGGADGARIPELHSEDWQVIENDKHTVLSTFKTEKDAVAERVKLSGDDAPEPIQEIQSLMLG